MDEKLIMYSVENAMAAKILALALQKTLLTEEQKETFRKVFRELVFAEVEIVNRKFGLILSQKDFENPFEAPL